MDTDQYIAQLNSPVKEITEQLCRIVRTSSDNLTEQIKWSSPVFSKNGNICSVIAHKSHVNLQIFKGAHIPDAKELDGNGRDMRHIKFRTVEDIHEQAVLRYLQQAIKLDESIQLKAD